MNLKNDDNMIINNDNNVLQNVVRRIEIKKGDDNG